MAFKKFYEHFRVCDISEIFSIFLFKRYINIVKIFSLNFY